MFLCRRVCCCCYSEGKNANPVTLTRAETITAQPTTSAGMEMRQVVEADAKPPTATKDPPDDAGSVTSDLDEIDLNEQVPTAEELQLAEPPSQADQTFAAAVTDMMLDEIHEDTPDDEKSEFTEEVEKIDNNAVIEATDEEVQSTMKRPMTASSSKEESENPISEPVSVVVQHAEVQKAETKAEPHVVPDEPSPVSDARSLSPATFSETGKRSPVKSLIEEIEEEVSRGSPQICELTDENTEERKVLPALTSTPVPEPKATDDSERTVEPTEPAEQVESVKSEEPVESAERSANVTTKQTTPKVEEAVDDETTASTDFEMTKPHPITPSSTLENVVRTSTNMYGDLSSSDDESELESESESESLPSPRKKPNRVSVKQTNVVITKVTALDAPTEEHSEVESEVNGHAARNKHNNDYVVLTDEEFSEKVI